MLHRCFSLKTYNYNYHKKWSKVIIMTVLLLILFIHYFGSTVKIGGAIYIDEKIITSVRRFIWIRIIFKDNRLWFVFFHEEYFSP